MHYQKIIALKFKQIYLTLHLCYGRTFMSSQINTGWGSVEMINNRASR